MRRVREIPKRNYRIYALIVIVTLFFAITSYVIYNNQKNYEKSIPVLRGVASEIDPKDLEHYLVENDSAILYFGVATDENSREVEEGLKDLITRKNLDIIYVNLTDLEDKDDFFKNFNEKYSNGLNLDNYPAFAILKNQKVLDFVQKGDRELYIGDIEQLVDIYELRGESSND